MDILKPHLVWIEDRCYRKLPIKNSETKVEEELVISKVSIEDEDDYSNLGIKFSDNRFWTSVAVPSVLLKFIIGKQYRTIKTIEQQTGARLKILAREEIRSEIAITGESKRVVGAAYYRIESILSSSRWSVDSTHFISLPINSRTIQESFVRFRENILSTCKTVRGINSNIFQTPAKLHLTVNTLVLLDDNETENAFGILQKCKSEIINVLSGKKLFVHVKGIEYMNDDPAEVDVLYAKVQETDGDSCLQIIANLLAKEFVKGGYAKQQYDSVKLHITLMNSIFGSKEDGAKQRRDTFDARRILQKYADFDFGEMELNEVHISIRYTEGDGGYYRASSLIKF